MNFSQNIKSGKLEKTGERWDLVEFKKRAGYLIADLIFFNSCKKGSYDSVFLMIC